MIFKAYPCIRKKINELKLESNWG